MKTRFLKITMLLAVGLVSTQFLAMSQSLTPEEDALATELFQKYEIPEWFKDAKFGIWLHWGPQSIPTKGGGWYARHMYMEPQKLNREPWGKEAWQYHRDNYGHQSEFGYKDICNTWTAEKFDAQQTVTQFKTWGAKYVAIIANHHDNFDLFNSSVHQWNSLKVGPHRDLVGEFAKAANDNGLKWVATVHAFRSKQWYSPAFGSDSAGPKKGVPYDANLKLSDGKGKWWEGLDPQQFYAVKNPNFEKELTQRVLDLVNNYKPDMLYFDDHKLQSPLVLPSKRLYLNSYKKYGSNQAIVTVKEPTQGTLLDFEKGTAESIQESGFQTDTTLASDWFLKPNPDGSVRLRHNARSLKELLVDNISKNGTLLLNIAVNADGSIPPVESAIMDEFAAWLKPNAEPIYATRPWKVFGEGGTASGGHFKERGIDSVPWDYHVVRFTRSKDNLNLYAHVFGNPAGKEIVIRSLGEKKMFAGVITSVSIVGGGAVPTWKLVDDGLHVKLPQSVPFKDCNVLKIVTNGL